MRTFGKRADGKGGRRSLARNPMLLPAAVTSFFGHGKFMTLLDVSATGARLSGSDLPEVGRNLLLRVEGVEAFGTVMWVRGDSCGVVFDRTLTPLNLRNLNHENLKARVMKLTPEKKRAFDAWQTNIIR